MTQNQLKLHLPNSWTPEDVQEFKRAAKAIAASLGCYITSGPGAKEKTGDLIEMLQYMNAGEILLMFHTYDHPDDMRADAEKLRTLAKEQYPGTLHSTFNALAAALEDAAKLKEEIGENNDKE